MAKPEFNELLEAGVHFGHLKRKWNPNMAPYIFMERNGIHIIDLHKTAAKVEEASAAIKQIAKSGRKVLFVATKKQAKEIVSDRIKDINMPYVTERWPGGMLTNFPTIRKAVKKMTSIDKMMQDGTFDTFAKRERLQITRQRAKLQKVLGSIADLTRLPAALFIVDVSKEYIAVREAKRLNIPVFGIVDTNTNPKDIDFVIPANDDASKSIAVIIDYIANAIKEGLEERKAEKEQMAKDKEKQARSKDKKQEDKTADSAGTSGRRRTRQQATQQAESTSSGESKTKTKVEQPSGEKTTAVKAEKEPEKEEKKSPAKKAAATGAPDKKQDTASAAKENEEVKKAEKTEKPEEEPEKKAEEKDKTEKKEEPVNQEEKKS